MKLDAKLRMLCHARGWSQADLSRQLRLVTGRPVPITSIGPWLRGHRTPDLKSALGLARVFDVSVDFLANDGLDTPRLSPVPDRTRVLIARIQAAEREAADALRRLVELLDEPLDLGDLEPPPSYDNGPLAAPAEPGPREGDDAGGPRPRRRRRAVATEGGAE